jgi:multidrug resistance efflux pump
VTTKFLLLLPLAALAAAATSGQNQSPSAGGRSLQVEDAQVMLIDENKVPATEPGMLTAVHVKEGQSIEKGQLLADIDNRETLAKRRIAEGELKAATKQAQNTAEIDVAEKAVEVSKAEHESYLKIRESNRFAVAEAELRKYYFQFEKALAQLKQANNEKLIAECTMETKQAQLDATGIELDLRQIKSPFKGLVVDIFKKPGDWAQSGEAMMYIVGLDRLRVEGFIQANLASPVEILGKPVVITAYSAAEKKHTVKGTIGFASPVIVGVGESRRFRIWAEVDNEKLIDPVTRLEYWKLQPGSKAEMTIDLTPPPPPKPPVPTKTEPSKGGTGSGKASPADGKSAPPPAPGGKVESLKPVAPAEASKADAGKSTSDKAGSDKAGSDKTEAIKGAEKSEKKDESKPAASTAKDR